MIGPAKEPTVDVQLARGGPGLSQEDQIDRATTPLMAAETAVADLVTLKTLLANRDLGKFRATWDHDAKSQADRPTGELIGFLVVAMVDDADEDDRSSSDLTQD